MDGNAHDVKVLLQTRVCELQGQASMGHCSHNKGPMGAKYRCCILECHAITSHSKGHHELIRLVCRRSEL